MKFFILSALFMTTAGFAAEVDCMQRGYARPYQIKMTIEKDLSKMSQMTVIDRSSGETKKEVLKVSSFSRGSKVVSFGAHSRATNTTYRIKLPTDMLHRDYSFAADGKILLGDYGQQVEIDYGCRVRK